MALHLHTAPYLPATKASDISERPEIRQVLPEGWLSDPEQETWTLADLEYLIPPVFLRFQWLWRVNEDADRVGMTLKLEESLRVTLSQCRTLTGILVKENGEVKIVRSRGGSIPFIVRKPEGGKSFESLQATGFPPLEVERTAGLEEMGDASSNVVGSGRPVLEIQLTWISGGLILTAGYHHYCVDGGGFASFLRQWQKNFFAQSKKAAMPNWDARNLNRERLNGTFVPFEKRITVPTVVPAVTAGNSAILPPTHPRHPVLLRFSRSGIIRLKAAATTLGGKQISSFVAVTALLWRVQTRARTKIYDTMPGESTALRIAMDLRGRFKPALPSDLQANAILGVGTDPISVLDVIADGKLPDLASRVRQAIPTDAAEVASGRADTVAGLRDKTLALGARRPPHRFAMGMSDLRGHDFYELDFGYGRPAAVLNCHEKMAICMMRSLCADLNSSGDDDVLEVQVPVEVPCLASYTQDPELLKYAKVLSA